MPDLNPDAVRHFWQERHDHALYRIIASMEGVERWTHDNDAELEEVVKRFADLLDEFPKFELAEEEKLIKTLTAIKSSRALRLLQHIDGLQPGAASKLLIYAEVASNSPSDLSGFFLKRNLVFERLQLLGRIFAAERFALVNRALEKEEAGLI